MLKVIKEIKSQGKTVFYKIQNQAGNEADIRPSQLDDFCILREFENAAFKDGKLVPIGDGFEITTHMTPIEQRKEQLLNFVNMLFSADIRVSAIERSRTAKCDPTEFQLESLGYVGKIRILPGTEGFNRRIVDQLHFTNVRVEDCRDIDPSYGYGRSYIGWKTSCSNYVSNLSSDYYFRIESRPYYMYDWMKNRGYDEFDVDYLVFVKGNVNGCAVVGKNNKILDTVVFKQN